MQGALGCLGCGRLVDEHHEPTGSVQTQLGTGVKDALLEQRWRLVSPLGRGKRSTVWLAHDVPFDRRVVVKLLDEASVSDAAAVERFEKNARGLARVDHKNVVAVLSLGRHGGVPFVAMRQAEGRSLAEHLHARGGRVAAAEAAHIVAQLAEGFAAVHREAGPQGALKPRAVFVSDREARVTLLDVRVGGDAAESADATTQHTERLAWLAPEVLRGAAATVASDVFMLGCVAWELVNGAAPQRGLLAEPVPLLEQTDDFAAAVARATRDAVAERFASAEELQAALASTAARFVPEAAAPPAAPARSSAPRPVEVQAPVPGARPSAPPARGHDLPTLVAPPVVEAAPGRARELPTVPSAPVAPAPPVRAEEKRTRQMTALDDVALAAAREAAGRALPKAPSGLQKTDAVVAGVIALVVAAVVVALTWERAKPLEPLKVQALAPRDERSEEARKAEAILDERVTPETVLDRQKTFEKTYGDSARSGKGRKVTTQSRRQVAEFLGGTGRFGELQVIVLYGGQQVASDVSVDGKRVGPSPIFKTLSPGAHVIGIERPGLEPVTVPVAVAEHKSTRMEIELVPLE